MKRKERYIQLALELARLHGDHKDQLHGAVLVRGSRVINVGWNAQRYHSLANRFCNQQGVYKLLHAEASAISGVDDCSGADIYVARYKKGKAALSKPCYVCEGLLRHLKIRRVFYSISDDEIGVLKL